MINTVKTSFFLLVVLVLSACNDSRKLETIRQAEMLLMEQPDSALRMLQTINRHSLRGETLARYALVYSIAQDKSGQDVANDSLLRIAHEYYCQHPDDSLYARSQYYMGLYYTLADSTKQAEDCLRTAIRYAEERKEYYTQYLALDRLSREIRYSDAPLGLKYSKQALDVYMRNCPINTNNQIFLLQDMGTVFLLCNMEDSAMYYMNKALNEAELHKDSSIIAGIIQDKSLIYTKQNDYQQALLCAKEAWKLSAVKSLNLISRLANCYADADSADQATELYNVIIKNGDYEHQYIAFKNLSVLAAKEHKDSLSRLYSDSAYECMEAIYNQQLKTKAAYYNDVIQLEEDKLQKERENANKKLINWCLVMLFIIALVIGFATYNNIRYRNRQRLKVERERQLLHEAFARKQHEREIEYKDRCLSIMKKYLMSKEAFPEKVKKVRHGEDGADISPQDWKEIISFLNGADNLFVDRIMAAYPNLSQMDYQLLMLIRLNFSNLQLANIYHINESSMKQKLYEAKSMVNLTDKNLSLRQFVLKF